MFFPLTLPGKYTWRSAGSDYPVTVIENLGLGPDQRIYLKIEESVTAIPLDEIVESGRFLRRKWMELMGLSLEEIDRNCPIDEFFDYKQELIEYNAIIEIQNVKYENKTSRKPPAKRIFE